MEAKVKFVAVDMPEATPFMLHIYAPVAQEEARAISARTKAALAAAQRRGMVLGKTGQGSPIVGRPRPTSEQRSSRR
jgi:DNA invertase Pin-like site-specific DNA recombinase